MTRIAYTVIATLPDVPTADRYVAWLQDGHLDAVLAGGAHSAVVVRYDPEGAAEGAVRVEVRYIFATRELYDRYIDHHAPALRADGVKHFGSVAGVSFERRTGVVL